MGFVLLSVVCLHFFCVCIAVLERFWGSRVVQEEEEEEVEGEK